ncbi:hypothetical protein BJX66DRAFT_301947 [Aspergillus keveii]|uniref:Uncharacterized protein n=1 Tax=Aspergillus keveii TaxID=714993 RepID=A0ABR4G8M1_9EURO
MPVRTLRCLVSQRQICRIHNISAGNETENRCLPPGKSLHSTQRRDHNRAGISLEANFKITIDKNGSPRRSQGKSEQLTAPQRAPSSTKTIARGIAEPGAVNSAPQTATSRSEKQSSFPDRESVSKVALPSLIELSKMPQERQHLTDGNDRQGEDLRSSLTSELLLRMVAPDSKRAFGLTSDTTHRQTLLQELHKEVERTLLNTDEQLHRYIEAERMAVNEVLEEYRNTINRVVEAQTKRITLCQQEKASIMQEYAICQGPGPHLQEDLGKGA